jgi:hypothetical protein
MAEWAKQTKI